MTRLDPQIVSRLYTRKPNLTAICRHLPDVGDSICSAATNLSRNLTVEKSDALLTRFRGTEQSVADLRRALAERGNP